MEQQPRRNVPALTGLRGIAAAWVVLFHLHKDGPIVANGYLGVDVFFILSGFVLSYVYAGQMRPGSPSDYLGFLRARLARIYPLHFVTLMVLAFLVLSLPHFADRYATPDARWGIGAFIASLLLVQNWAHFLPTAWNAPAWSLSAEWFAYLLFPGFLLATQWPKSKYLPVTLAALALAALTLMLMRLGLPTPDAAGTPGMARMGCEFAAGCLLYRASANGLRALPRAIDALAFAGILVAALAGGRLTFLALPGFALLVLLAAQASPTSRFLSLRPVVFLGEISYSIYMVHWIAIQVSNWLLARGLDLGIAPPIWNTGLLMLSVGLATLSYRFIEQPARAWSRGQGGVAAFKKALTSRFAAGKLPAS